MKHAELMAEVVSYGREVLKMSDTEMAAELGYSTQRVWQFRRVATDACSCGTRINDPGMEQCARCRRSPDRAFYAVVCACGCHVSSNRVRQGHTECSVCYWRRERRRLYNEDPAYKALHDKRCAASRRKARGRKEKP